MRRLAGTRRVGHAGTLDPMATGVLLVGIERATKLLGHLALTDKTYLATIRLGQATVTDDAEGEVTATSSAAGVTDEGIAAGVAALTGDIQQVPSSVSAIKVDGQRSYARVRAGEDVKLAARPVTVEPVRRAGRAARRRPGRRRRRRRLLHRYVRPCPRPRPGGVARRRRAPHWSDWVVVVVGVRLVVAGAWDPHPADPTDFPGRRRPDASQASAADRRRFGPLAQ